MMASLTL